MTSRLERNKQSQKKIDNEEKRQKFKKRFRIFFKIFLIISIILTIIFSTMYFIGNAGIVVKEYAIDYDNLPDSFYGFKVIHLTDINYGQTVNKAKLDKISKRNGSYASCKKP